MSTNIIIIEGNLGRDPESRSFTSGARVISFPVGVNRRYQSNSGEEKEETSWIDVKAYGKAAESAACLMKGSRVLCIGEIRQENWIDKQTNNPRNKLVMVANTVSGIARHQQAEPQPPQGYGPPPQAYPPAGPYGSQPSPQAYPPPQPQYGARQQYATAPQQPSQYVPQHPVADTDIPLPVASSDDTPF